MTAERDVVAVRRLEVEARGRPHVGHALDVGARRKQQLEARREHADDLRAAVAEIDVRADDCRDRRRSGAARSRG